ncbi:ABC transporter ATP-binding protein [Mesorhizobium sp. M2D.F.Ca.ET.185.01.1.1]|uniref:ABC transporter ATP-binding protein n=1 Tax=unclassified Mesorhizobium TaxID=325217 RepID=UPI000FCC9FF2|nr:MULTISPECIES: dipeptide ABC transporter ATP-binding protein [unclassified Mesorhizobium]TGP50347.1 ABC transporter ATP-binding protein [bacterium M00.F.Ca.ET.230.01.1.1]TGP79341.1 ABC transporter ATP-binding protein [bacterium M00.F.Ca.ET.227.01.1.1]TGQ00921.1 ABC transporter ATP-binding protein [bacterium M00.F.Ca.ET.221.01.1.1]TGQ02560.1 ABC transporter ATP-binding protein [bacterium M00.F.Ca.ET.222.01.1.1]TGU12452.1 ABC transporter ATP-binding protein [bacterium M00.F.Ca.ET.163.01.1.1]T
MSLLEIENLSLTIGATPILKGVELTIAPGEVVGLVGESGSGKSMTALTIMQLLPHLARTEGRVIFDGIDILKATEDQMCALRGDDIGMVFQEPMTALNPVKTIGEQVAEGIRWHTKAGRAEAEERARKILDRVGLPEAKFPLSRYPHELSGGQRQRVVIAIACALKPKLLIADEPTTALDVVLQAQILDLLRDLVRENRMGLLLISHDLAVVTEMADRLTILRHGEVTEAGDTARTLSEQQHPYTRELALASMHVPARPKKHLAGSAKPLLEVDGVGRDYPSRRASLFRPAQPIRAVDDVSLTIEPAQSVALVGRSGCGKSTLARMILALDKPTAGTIRFRGEAITGKPEQALKPARRDMQVVFQDPYGSFDPRQKVEKLVAEPLHLLEKQLAKAERREMIAHALDEVGLGPRDMGKYPHEFSGGQRQRLSIARAIITRPKLVVADEPVSALDVSIRAQILDLFAELNQKLGIAYLFITHDLTVARAMADEVLVMHEGKIVERGKTGDVLDHPRSEAAQALVAAAPDLHRAIARKMQEQG